MKEVSCEVIRDLLPLYEDGAASEESAELVREHLKNCPACRAELEKLQTTVSLPPEEEGELWKQIRKRMAGYKKQKRIVGATVLLLAAAILFCLWYTRSQYWWEIAGDWNFTDLRGIYSTALGVEARIELDTDGEFNLPLNQFKVVLQGEYRAPLSSIFHNLFAPDRGYTVPQSRSSVQLTLIREDTTWIQVNAYEVPDCAIVYVSGSDRTGSRCYQIGAGTYEILVRLIQDNGMPG